MAVSSPKSTTFKSPRGQILFQPPGMQAFPFGDTDFTRTADFEESEIYTNEFAIKTLVSADVDQQNWSLNITARNMTDYLEMIASLSDPHVLDQAAAVAVTVTQEDVEVGSVIVTGKRQITVTSVKDGTAAGAVAYVEGVNYSYDKEGGFVSILSKPDGAGDDVTVTFSVAASKVTRYHLGELSEVRGRVIFIENVKQGRDRAFHEYFDVGFRPDGDVTFVGSDAVRAVQIKGRCYPDTAKPAGQQLAYIDVIRAA